MPRNRYFYFSDEECKYVEVKRGQGALFAALFVALLLLSGGAVATLHFYFKIPVIPFDAQSQADKEIQRLNEKLDRMAKALEKLAQADNSLRLAVNLPTVSEEEKRMGTGGNRLSLLESPMPAALATTAQLINQLARRIENQERSYAEIFSKYKENQELFARIPAIKPINAPRTSGFGMRLHPIYQIMKFHSGQDFTAPIGTPIYATGNGVVETASFVDGYGNCVIIDHGFGYKTVYAHQSKLNVKVGQAVKRGQLIGFVGNTGVSEAPHLHYEVIKDGVKVNPSSYFFEDMTPEEYNAAAQATERALTKQ
ncbi:MAG: M23 family metallopeptidase [Chloroherpetonaceae bacterium]|nr:M23 family metallopeptidase [Chloroherpetonaceae bacterium]MDW8437938.1 M23 family metallopeptidase [Chloroherpetonaceae bacterium]